MHERENPYNHSLDARRRDVLKGLHDTMLEAAIDYAEQGAAIVLLHPRDKKPIAKGWTDAPRMSAEEVERAIGRARVTHGDVNIGVRLGEPSRLKDGFLHVVDVDIRNARESKRCLEEALAAVHALAPELEEAPRVLSGSGSGSCHIYFVTDKPLAKKTIARSKRKCGDRPEWEAELFGTGAQVVLPPSVHPSGDRYRWDRQRRPFFDDGRQRGRRILVSAENLAPLYERRRERSARDAAAVKIFGGRIDVVRSALDVIGNDDLDYDEWFRRLCALHFEGDGLDEWCELAHEYSRKSGKYDADTTDRKWDSIKDKHADPVTGATIRQLARDVNWTPESAGFPGFEWGDGPEIVFEDERERALPDSRRRGLRFHYAGDLHRLPEATYLVKALWFEGQLSCVYGQPGASKTFFALDVALHIALGRSWFGCDVKRGVVIYIALEGVSGIYKRAEAACKHHDVELSSVPIVFGEGVMDLANDKVLSAQIADEAKRASEHFGLPVRAIVIDTLARAMSGGDENSAKDMGNLIAGADAIRMATGAHVCLVHHEGKDRDKGMRGSSSLLGAVDTAIAIGRDKSNPHAFEARMTKQKEDETGRPRRYTLDRVTLTRCGEDGEPLTSAVVTPLSAIEFQDERMSARERAAVVILRRLVDESTDGFDDEGDGAQAWIGIQKWKRALEKSDWPAGENKPGAGNVRARTTIQRGQAAGNLRASDYFDREFRRLKQNLVNKGIIEIDSDTVSFAADAGGRRPGKKRATRQGEAGKRAPP